MTTAHDSIVLGRPCAGCSGPHADARRAGRSAGRECQPVAETAAAIACAVQTLQALAEVADLRGREASRCLTLRIQQPEHFGVARGVGARHHGEGDGCRRRCHRTIAEGVLHGGDTRKVRGRRERQRVARIRTVAALGNGGRAGGRRADRDDGCGGERAAGHTIRELDRRGCASHQGDVARGCDDRRQTHVQRDRRGCTARRAGSGIGHDHIETVGPLHRRRSADHAVFAQRQSRRQLLALCEYEAIRRNTALCRQCVTVGQPDRCAGQCRRGDRGLRRQYAQSQVGVLPVSRRLLEELHAQRKTACGGGRAADRESARRDEDDIAIDSRRNRQPCRQSQAGNHLHAQAATAYLEFDVIGRNAADDLHRLRIRHACPRWRQLRQGDRRRRDIRTIRASCEHAVRVDALYGELDRTEGDVGGRTAEQAGWRQRQALRQFSRQQ